MDESKFDFIYLSNKTITFFENKIVQEYLMKWSMKGNLKLKFYNFNQSFKSQNTENFVKAFFTSPEVYSTLEVYNYSRWTILGQPCEKVNFEIVPCSVTSMEFFDRLLEPNNGIVRSEKGEIITKYEVKRDPFYSNDNFRACLLEEDTKFYKLYSVFEKAEFIFKLLFHFAIGGSLCQFEDNIKPYLDTVKKIYKEIISVNKIMDKDEVRVRSIVLKVIAYTDNSLICPMNPDNPQNFVYLIIDSFTRQVAVLAHQYID